MGGKIIPKFFLNIIYGEMVMGHIDENKSNNKIERACYNDILYLVL